jgi:hypothetical protein
MLVPCDGWPFRGPTLAGFGLQIGSITVARAVAGIPIALSTVFAAVVPNFPATVRRRTRLAADDVMSLLTWIPRALRAPSQSPRTQR